MRRRLLSAAAIATIVAGIAVCGSGAASAETTLDEIATTPELTASISAAAVAKADEAGYVVVSGSSGVPGKDGATFYPTGAIDDDTIVVITDPNGKLPDGLTTADLRQFVAEKRAGSSSQARSSSGTIEIAPLATSLPRAYTANSTAMSGAFTGQSIWGWDASATVGYSFNVAIDSQQVNAAQGQGWYRGYSGSTFGTWSAWYNLGTTDADSLGGGTVPWGSVIASAKFRARCAATTFCWGNWAP